MSHLPVNPDSISDQLKLSRDLLSKWISTLDSGLVHIDVPGSDSDLSDVLKELCGELLLVSRTTEAISEIIAQSELS